MMKINIDVPIVFFGTEEFSALALQELISHGYKIEAVVTKPDARRGRGKKLTEPIVKSIAKTHSIPVLQPHNSSELSTQLADLNKNIGVLVSYGMIIPESVIKSFKKGIINIHPSLLPLYRGSSPIEAAILNGDVKTGVTLMGLSQKMDAGPIFIATEIPLSGKETAPELYKTLGRLGAGLLIESLPSIISGSLQSIEQDETIATYTTLIKKEDGLLDHSTETAVTLERKVRAYEEYPKSFILSETDNQRLIVKKAHTADKSEHQLSFEASDGRFFIIDKLLNRNGKLVTTHEYINSIKN